MFWNPTRFHCATDHYLFYVKIKKLNLSSSTWLYTYTLCVGLGGRRYLLYTIKQWYIPVITNIISTARHWATGIDMSSISPSKCFTNNHRKCKCQCLHHIAPERKWLLRFPRISALRALKMQAESRWRIDHCMQRRPWYWLQRLLRNMCVYEG